MIRTLSVFVALCALVAPSPAQASDLVEMGRATIDGRQVVLLEDGTWRLAGTEPASDRCEGEAEVFMRIAPVSFCLDPDEWAAEGAVNQHDAVFASSVVPDLYLGITVGWGDFTTETLREAILGYALEASGQEELDVEVDEPVTVDGANWHRVAFNGPSPEGDFMFWNVFRAGPYANVQLLLWAPAGKAEAAAPVVEKVLSTVRMNGW